MRKNDYLSQHNQYELSYILPVWITPSSQYAISSINLKSAVEISGQLKIRKNINKKPIYIIAIILKLQ